MKKVGIIKVGIIKVRLTNGKNVVIVLAKSIRVLLLIDIVLL